MGYQGDRTVPSALLHDGADELANQGQELLCVSGVELLQKRQQPEHQWGPVDRVCCLPARHSCTRNMQLC